MATGEAKRLIISGKKVLIDEKNWNGPDIKVSEYLWHVTGRNIVQTKRNGTTISLHRYVMRAKKHESVIAIDKNYCNCVESNLRIVSAQWRGLTKKSKTGYVGVYELTHRPGKFKAMIQRDTIGYFSSPKLAAEAYDREALKRFGLSAQLNFPSLR